MRNGQVELEPTPREVRIFPKGKLWVAEPVESGVLTAEMVRQTQNWIRDRGLQRKARRALPGFEFD